MIKDFLNSILNLFKIDHRKKYKRRGLNLPKDTELKKKIFFLVAKHKEIYQRDVVRLLQKEYLGNSVRRAIDKLIEEKDIKAFQKDCKRCLRLKN